MKPCRLPYPLPSSFDLGRMPHRHVEDYRAALDYVRGPDLVGRVDSSRVALWGTSFAGGHVIRVAAADLVPDKVGSIRAVISQVTGRGSVLSQSSFGGLVLGGGLAVVIEQLEKVDYAVQCRCCEVPLLSSFCGIQAPQTASFAAQAEVRGRETPVFVGFRG